MQIFEQLGKIFPLSEEDIQLFDSLDQTQKSSYPPFVVASYHVHEIATDTTLNTEEKINHLEAFLIKKIKSEKESSYKNFYMLALNLSLYNRGYFTDYFGKLEKKLLLLPHEDSLNPDLQFQSDPKSTQSMWQFINTIRVELTNCFNRPGSYLSKVETLAKIIRNHIHLSQLLKPEHDIPPEQLEQQEKSKKFILTFLDAALELIDNSMVDIQPEEWSIWASACLESLDYISDPTSQQSTDDAVHSIRRNYFLSLCEAFNEPIKIYVDHVLLKSSPTVLPLSQTQPLSPIEALESLKSIATSSEKSERMHTIQKAFTEAYQLVIAEEKGPDFLSRVIQCAIILDDNNCSAGTFIKTVACMFTEPLSLKHWRSQFEILQCIAVPQQWRAHFSNIWLTLASFLLKNYSETHKFCRNAAVTCIKQIKYSNINSDIDTVSEIQTLLEMIHTIKSSIPNIEDILDDIVPYRKEKQYQFCKYLLHSSINGDNLSEQEQIVPLLLESENPYQLYEFMKILYTNSPLQAVAFKLAQLKYGTEITSPLSFCEKVLQPTNFNKYLIIFGSLACGISLEKKSITPFVISADSIASDETLFKQVTSLRQALREKLLDQNGANYVVPCGFEYLDLLDRKLCDLFSQVILEGKKESQLSPFKFAQDREGLLEAIYGLVFFFDGNYYAAEYMADLSIEQHSAMTFNDLQSRFQSLHPESASVVGSPTQRSPEIPRKKGSLKVNRLSDPTRRLTYERLSYQPNQLQSRSPSEPGGMAIPAGKNLRARSFLLPKSGKGSSTGIATPIPMSPVQNCSSPMGHLIKAMLLWETRIKNNKKFTAEDIVLFQDALISTKNTSIPSEERNFITGMRWLNYLLSYDTSTHKGNTLWQFESDHIQYKDTKRSIMARISRTHSKEIKEKNDGKVSEYIIFRIAYFYLLNKESRDNPNTKKFPPAILIIFVYLRQYIQKYAPSNSNSHDLDTLATLLKEAVFDDGYFPAIPAYLSCHSAAHPEQHVESEVLRTALTPLDRIQFIRNALLYSESSFPFMHRTLVEINEKLNSLEEIESQKTKRVKTYASESPFKLNHQFSCTPININHAKTPFTIDFTEEESTQCTIRAIELCRDEDSSPMDDVIQIIKHHFQHTTRIYSYCKKVKLADEEIIIENNDGLIIKHADIAIIGIIYLAEGKCPSLVLNRFQQALLNDLLSEAKEIHKDSWQWEGTHTRLQNFDPHSSSTSSSNQLNGPDPEELRDKLKPLSSMQGNSPPSLGVSISPRRTRGSFILPNPRRETNTGELPSSSPTSPRSYLNSPRRGSGTITMIPDTSRRGSSSDFSTNSKK